MIRHTHWNETLASLAAGLIFGVGLVASGMTQSEKVLAFLDLASAWDPSLAFVMGAALVVAFPWFALSAGRAKSVFGLPMRLPSARDIDRKLLAGAAAFGVGWGLVGLCPGPALVALATGSPKAVLFAVAMLAGMGLYEAIVRKDELKTA